MEYTEILNLFLENMKKVFYPEDWIELDLSFSKSELFTMLMIDRHGEVIMSQIAEYTNIPMSTATGMVDRLVRNGYLKRERSESDRRIVVIKLTESGKSLISQMKKVALEYIKLVYDSLDEEERFLLTKVFMKVVDIISRKNLQSTEIKKEDQIRKIEIE